MKVNPNIFRGYDLRGLVDEDLSPEVAEHLGRAFGTYLKRRGITEAVVGRDCRATSPAYSEALIKGFNQVGVQVIDIGMLLVGMFYWSQYHLKRQGGVYVSASHNPPEFNGFKFANNYSETLVSDGMQELLRLVQEEDYDLAETPATVEQRDIRQVY
jgi:phosphomannomutase / phosphoglucomutase